MEDKKNEGENQRQNIRDRMARLSQGVSWAEQRSITVGDEFIRLEVQIATIIFAFSGLSLDKFNSEIQSLFSNPTILFLKIVFALSLIFLLVSLACGLLHLKNRERFCDTVLNQRVLRLNKWREALEAEETSFKEALAYDSGTRLGEGPTVSEPKWTWILQSVCLGIGVIGLLTLTLVILFS